MRLDRLDLMSSIALTVFLSATIASADTITVRPDGTGDHATIQAAIDAAVNGDEVVLTSGTFTGDGNRDLTYLGKSITVRSETGDPTSCVLDVGGTLGDSHRGFRFDSGEGPGAVLDGITVTNGYAPEDLPSPLARRGGALICVGSSPTIRNCRFVANEADWAGGVQLWESATVMTDCVVAFNHSNVNGGGIYCSLTPSPTLERVTVYGNTTTQEGGALAINSSFPTIRNCTLVDNSSGIWTINDAIAFLENTIIAFNAGPAMKCAGGGSAELGCCDVFGNTEDYTSCISGQETQNGNIGEDPRFCDPDLRDYSISENSACAPNSMPNPTCGLIGAHPVVCGFVSVQDASWGEIKARFRK